MSNAIELTFLGGLGEIGRNCLLIRDESRYLVVDCGLMFPTEDMPGIDLILPDIEKIISKDALIDGLVITHGHEDHIGAIPYIAKDVSFKVYGSSFANNLIKAKLEQEGIKTRLSFIDVKDNDRLQIGSFLVEFIPITHSVPSSHALYIKTSKGSIFHTGDFKIDLTPVDERRPQLSRIGTIASNEGIDLLLADSTNAEVPGFGTSESEVKDSLRSIFLSNREYRIIVSCFASNINRIKTVIELGSEQKRKICFIGRSLQRNVSIARELGLLEFNESNLVEPQEIGDYPPSSLLILVTGSQGEPFSVLSQIGAGEARYLKIRQGDLVILSSRPIPGNEKRISILIDALLQRGAKVIHSNNALVHTSGHAFKNELQILMAIAKAKYVIPIHGEYRHLSANADIALRQGISKKNVLIALNGDVIRMYKDKIEKFASVDLKNVLIEDDLDVDINWLNERQNLSENGLVILSGVVNSKNKELVSKLSVAIRGWGLPEGNSQIKKDIVEAAESVIAYRDFDNENGLNSQLIKVLSKLIHQKTGKRPVVIPIILNV